MSDDAADRAAKFQSDWLDHEYLITGLRDGDLSPLARHLRAGIPFPQFVADEIADMIEGRGALFNIGVSATGDDRRGWTKRLTKDRQKMQIGVFVETRIEQLGAGCVDAVVTEAAAKFHVGTTAVKNARAFVRTKLAHIIDVEMQAVAWKVWSEAYSGDQA